MKSYCHGMSRLGLNLSPGLILGKLKVVWSWIFLSLLTESSVFWCATWAEMPSAVQNRQMVMRFSVWTACICFLSKLPWMLIFYTSTIALLEKTLGLFATIKCKENLMIWTAAQLVETRRLIGFAIIEWKYIAYRPTHFVFRSVITSGSQYAVRATQGYTRRQSLYARVRRIMA